MNTVDTVLPQTQIQPGRNLLGRHHALRCSLTGRGTRAAAKKGLYCVQYSPGKTCGPRRVYRLEDVIAAGLASEIGSYRSAPAGSTFPSEDELKALVLGQVAEKTKPRRYYAACWRYGRAHEERIVGRQVLTRPIRDVFAFPSRSAREAWLDSADNLDDRRGPYFCEALERRDLRRHEIEGAVLWDARRAAEEDADAERW